MSRLILNSLGKLQNGELVGYNVRTQWGFPKLKGRIHCIKSDINILEISLNLFFFLFILSSKKV